MPYKDLERRKEYNKVYRKKNKEKLLKQKKEYLQIPEVKERMKIYHRNYMKKYSQKPERKEYMKEWNKENKNKIKEYYEKYESKLWVKKRRKEYRQIPKVKFRMKEISKKWAIKNEERRKEYMKTPEIKAKKKEYDKNNRDKINVHYRQRKKNDKNYAIKERVRLAFLQSLKKYSKIGKTMSLKKYGVDMDNIIKHLKPFPEDRENYHIDHIKPLSSFNFVNKDGSTNLKEVRKAWHHSNLQWLTKEENLKKGSKIL